MRKFSTVSLHTNMPERGDMLPLVTMVTPKLVIWEKFRENPKAPIPGDFDI